MTNTIPKRGDVFFCQGSPDAIGSEERKTRPVVIIQNDAGNASSPTVIVANMTTNTSRRLYPMQFDIDLPGHSPSRVQCEQIRTVDKCRDRRRTPKTGHLPGRVFWNDPPGGPGSRPQRARSPGRHIPRTNPKRPVRGRLPASCAEPGEYNHNRRENGQHDTERRTGRRDRGRTSGYEGHAERGDAVSRSEEAAKKLAEALDIPEDQVLPCVVAFACLRYHGKSFVRKLANGTGPITTWQSLKIGVALFLWGRAQKKDPWGELYRITKFAQAWKEGDSI